MSRLFECSPWYLGRMVCSVDRDGRFFAVTTHLRGTSPPVTLVLNWMNALQD